MLDVRPVAERGPWKQVHWQPELRPGGESLDEM